MNVSKNVMSRSSIVSEYSSAENLETNFFLSLPPIENENEEGLQNQSNILYSFIIDEMNEIKQTE